MNWKKYIPDAQENALLAILVLIGAVISAKDVLGIIISDERAKYILIIVVFASIWRYASRQYKTSRLPSLPTTLRIFNPFRMAADAASLRIWRREEEEQELLDRLDETAQSHLVITGPSGAGKSTLVRDLLKPRLEARGNKIRFFYTYNGFVIDLIEGFGGSSEVIIRQRSLAARYRTFMSTHTCSVRDVFDPLFQSLDADALWAEIVTYLDKVLSTDTRTIFVFDQIERLVHLLKTDISHHSKEFNGFEVYFFVSLIRHLRCLPDVRTVFIIRADYLYQSFDFLENSTARSGDSGDVLLVHFLCPGINTMSAAGAVVAIREDFKKIHTAAPYAQEFERISGLDSRAYSNTFMIQLLGYIVEHFYKLDKRVPLLLQNGDDRSVALRYFFDYLLNDYDRQSSASDALDVLKVIIFTIAVENRIAGQSVSVPRLAALAHLPPDSVSQALDFLVGTGLVQEEERDGRPAFRMVHDVISDYTIENEQFSIDPILKDGIRGLSEARVRTERLTPVSSFADPIKDWVVQPNIGLCAIWAFYLFGSLKVLSLTLCQQFDVVLMHVWSARSCEYVGQFYLGIFVMHAVWVTYIYFIDRGYLRYTLKSPFARLVSKLLPVTGVVCGIAFSQSPTLFQLPLFVVGITLGLLLLNGIADGSFIGREAQMSRRWGERTIFNMIFSSSLMLLTSIVLWQDEIGTKFWSHIGEFVSSQSGELIDIGANGIGIFWMYFVSCLMLYFWWHIRPEQQSRISLAARLAVHDRTQLESTLA